MTYKLARWSCHHIFHPLPARYEPSRIGILVLHRGAIRLRDLRHPAQGIILLARGLARLPGPRLRRDRREHPVQGIERVSGGPAPRIDLVDAPAHINRRPG